MCCPYLLRPSFLARIGADALRRDVYRSAFGQLVSADLGSVAPTKSVEARILRSDTALEWRRAVAEELLLRKVCGHPLPADWVAEFAGVQPFDDCPLTLRACLDCPCACACFPLTGANRPAIGHVWVIRHAQWRNPDRQVPDAVADAAIAFCTSSNSEWDGNSWNLAARLAHMACENTEDRNLRHQLATAWVITGETDGDDVAKVKMGNKLDLRTPHKPTWLIPRDNAPTVPAETQERLVIRSAADVQSAYNHVSGRGTKSGESLPWPENVSDLHVLVGGSVKASLASVLLSKGLKNLVLWCSRNEESSARPGRAMLRIIEELRPDISCLAPLSISSSNLVDAEAALRRHFDTVSASPTLFNVTSGNRLMSYAVQNLVRLHPHVQMIYKDRDAEDFVFTWLDYTQFPPVSGIYAGSAEVRTDINWSFLFRHEKEPPFDTAAEMAAWYIENLVSA